MTIDSSGVFPENRKSCERLAPVVGCKQPTCEQKLQFRKKSNVKKGELPFFIKLFLPSAHGKRSLRSLCASKEGFARLKGI